MAYITPNSTVEFFGDLGISPNYENTLYFANVVAKDEYFSGLTKLATGTALSYNRAERGFFKIELPMSLLIHAGYIRFKNTSFEGKWFYAFVKSVEYINNVTTQVNFELDVMMTWMGSFQLGECYIERQHTLSDAIGANIASEGFSLGNYITEDGITLMGGDYKIVMFRSWKSGTTDTPPPARITQGTYIPILMIEYPFTNNGISDLNSDLTVLITDNRIDEVLAIKLVPQNYVSTGDQVPYNNMYVNKPYTTETGASYIPRNKKLLTYPFKYLEVDNCEGNKSAYRYEYFNTLPPSGSSGACYFHVYGSCSTPEPSVLCVPYEYNGETESYGESIAMNNFPSLCWNVDAYKAYLAQRDSTLFGNQISSVIAGAERGALSGAVGGIGGALVGSLAGAIGGLIGSSQQLLADTLNEMRGNDIPARMPNETRGTISSNIMVQIRQKAFYFRKKSITVNYAMMIDDFFDMYGYAIREHKVPRMDARPYWTYVKTKGCVVHGGLPADDGGKIESIFDNGIRFWKNHTHIGHYSDYNNAPV